MKRLIAIIIILIVCGNVSAQNPYVITQDAVKKAQQKYVAEEQRKHKIRMGARAATAVGAVCFAYWWWQLDAADPEPKKDLSVEEKLLQLHAYVKKNGGFSNQSPQGWFASAKDWGIWLLKTLRDQAAVTVGTMGISWIAHAQQQKSITLRQCVARLPLMVEINTSSRIPYYQRISSSALSYSANQLDQNKLTIIDGATGATINLMDQCIDNFTVFALNITRVAGYMHYQAGKYKEQKEFAKKALEMASHLVATVNVQGAALYQAVEGKRNKVILALPVATIVRDLFDEVTNVINTFATLQESLNT